MADKIDVEASSGDVSIRAVHNDNGLRMWQVEHGSDSYSYTTRNGLSVSEDQDNPSGEDFERTDVINISSDGTRYTAEFCSYSADATIFKEDGDLDDVFMRSAPDYGNEPASEEFAQGWDIISAKHAEVQRDLSSNPNYIKAADDIKTQLIGEGINPDGFFNIPSNEFIIKDATKGQDREVPSSVYWAEEIKSMDENLMNPNADTSQEASLDISIEVDPQIQSTNQLSM